MSLGGFTQFPGHELEDLLVLELLKEGVTVVSAVGNEGFAAITGGSPGTSVASLTVGATSTPQHERILRDLQLGAGMGEEFRPSDHLQTAYFSSRGPTADGRTGLQLMANGFAAFVQGADGTIAFVSGTSFAAPTVAGAAALLWQTSPQSSAAQIRDALINSANAAMLEYTNDSEIDRGRGFIDLVSAYDAIVTGNVIGQIPPLPEVNRKPSEVEENIKDLGVKVVELEHKPFNRRIHLMPGEVSHFFVETSLETDRIIVELSDIRPELPVEQQNAIFGDALLLNVVDAPTSINELLVDERLLRDATFTLSRPQTGIVRIAVLGDWTNAGAVSAKLSLREKQRDLVRPYAKGNLVDEETDNYIIDVDDNITQLNFELAWKADWGHYPAFDIDLLLISPSGKLNIDGATLASPERVTIDNPEAGQWTVLVSGFLLYGFNDQYELRIMDQDHRPMRQGDRHHR